MAELSPSADAQGAIQIASDQVYLARACRWRYDGTSYPHGLNGNEISLGSRIFAVAAKDIQLKDGMIRTGSNFSLTLFLGFGEVGWVSSAFSMTRSSLDTSSYERFNITALGMSASVVQPKRPPTTARLAIGPQFVDAQRIPFFSAAWEWKGRPVREVLIIRWSLVRIQAGPPAIRFHINESQKVPSTCSVM